MTPELLKQIRTAIMLYAENAPQAMEALEEALLEPVFGLIFRSNKVEYVVEQKGNGYTTHRKLEAAQNRARYLLPYGKKNISLTKYIVYHISSCERNYSNKIYGLGEKVPIEWEKP